MILMMVLIATAVSAEICEVREELSGNCTMLTPVLVECVAFNYSVINASSGDGVSSGTLTLLSEDIYYFNFSESEGDYIVKLCDGTTREIRVASEDDIMVLAAIIILPMLLALMLLIGAATLNEDHNPVRIVLFLMSVPLFWVSMHFGTISVIEMYGMTSLQEAMGDTTYWTAWVFFVIVSYFILYLFYKMFTNMNEAKKARLEY